MLAQALVRRALRVAVIAFESSAALPAQVEGVEIVARPAYRKPRRVRERIIEVCWIWRSLWRAPSPTIVYRTAGFELGLIAIYARLARRRLVFATASLADFEYQKHERRRLHVLLYDLGARLADAIVVQTEEQVRLCQATVGRTPTLIKSIAELAAPSDRSPIAFLWVGRLVGYKRPLEYIALARACPEARFWMVGVPPPTANEEDRVVAEEVAQQAHDITNLQLLRPRPRAALGTVMEHAVASVNTADFEGMPNVLLEAWGRGVPALVLNHDPDGVVETHGLGGFANGSFQRLVQLARQQWIGRNDRHDLSQRCRTYTQTYHAPDVVAGQWHSVLFS